MKYLIVILSFTWSSVLGQPDARGKIYISTDRGVNWSRADNGLPSDAYVAVWTIVDRTVIAGTDRHGVFISSDGMKSWYASSKGLPRNARILSIDFVQNLLLVGTYLHGLFYSDDLGESWHPSGKGLTNPNIRVLYHLDRIIFAGTDAGLFISGDGGISWNLFLNGLQINSMASVKKELIVATSKGVLRTNDLGKNWAYIFSQDAISSITCAGGDIYMLDYFGNAYKAIKESYVWIQADLFLPFRYTFRITPVGNQFFTSDWNNVLRGIDSTEEVFWANGIPEDLYIKELLETPYGVLAAVGGGC